MVEVLGYELADVLGHADAQISGLTLGKRTLFGLKIELCTYNITSPSTSLVLWLEVCDGCDGHAVVSKVRLPGRSDDDQRFGRSSRGCVYLGSEREQRLGRGVDAVGCPQFHFGGDPGAVVALDHGVDFQSCFVAVVEDRAPDGLRVDPQVAHRHRLEQQAQSRAVVEQRVDAGTDGGGRQRGVDQMVLGGRPQRGARQQPSAPGGLALVDEDASEGVEVCVHGLAGCGRGGSHVVEQGLAAGLRGAVAGNRGKQAADAARVVPGAVGLLDVDSAHLVEIVASELLGVPGVHALGERPTAPQQPANDRFEFVRRRWAVHGSWPVLRFETAVEEILDAHPACRCAALP